MKKGRLPVWGSLLFFFSSGPGLSGPTPRCGNSFSSGEAGRAAARPGPSSSADAATRACRRAAGKRRGHPLPFDNNIGSRRASTQEIQSKARRRSDRQLGKLGNLRRKHAGTRYRNKTQSKPREKPGRAPGPLPILLKGAPALLVFHRKREPTLSKKSLLGGFYRSFTQIYPVLFFSCSGSSAILNMERHGKTVGPFATPVLEQCLRILPPEGFGKMHEEMGILEQVNLAKRERAGGGPAHWGLPALHPLGDGAVLKAPAPGGGR